MFHATMTFDLGEDTNALRDFVHAWAQERVKPMAAQVDVDNLFPSALWKEMGDLGLLGVTVPEEFGGAGMSYLAHTVAVEEIARASASVSLSYGAHSNLCVNQIKLNGTDDQKAKYLPKLVSGDHVGALAMSEAGAGSDVVSMSLRAEKRNDHYRLNGNKYWITNGPEAETLIVYAKSDPDAGAKGITAFLIEKDMVGFSTSPHFEKLGMRGSNTAELIFDDVRVPFENVLGEEGKGFIYLMSQLPQERLSIAVSVMASSQKAFDETVEFTKTRKAFAGMVFDFQNTRFVLADLKAKLQVGWAHLDWAIARHLKGELTNEEGAAAKLWHTDLQWEVMDKCLQLHGGAGYMNEYPIARAWRAARVTRIFGGTNEIMKELIGRSL